MSSGIDPTSDRPAYLQIADHLRAAINTGELADGAQLPSERELMDTYRAARGTVRQAIATLRGQGLIDVEHGRGAFVRGRPPVRRLAHDRFARRHREAGKAAYLAELEAEGRRPEVEVLEVGPGPAPAEIAQRLGLAEGDRVLVRRRRYLADGRPMELATSYLPWDLAAGTAMGEKHTGPGGIYARLEEAGHRLRRFTEDVRARMPRPEEARALRLPPGVPVFVLVRTAYDQDGRPVEVCDTTMAADQYVLSYELPAH
jgi:GntR family transcriptional regulator